VIQRALAATSLAFVLASLSPVAARAQTRASAPPPGSKPSPAAPPPAAAPPAAPGPGPAGGAATAPAAAAPASTPEAQADALFNAGKQLREAGQYPEACARFAQSKQLAPGVGISLHLADCYERMGRTASAWQEFHSAEKMARERDDAKRAETAHNRAQSLEPKLNRLTVEVPADAKSGGAEVQVDGAPIPADAWNLPLAVDPGDHTVAFAVPGQAVRTFQAHVDAGTPMALVRVAAVTDAAAAAGAAAATTTAAASPPVPATTEPATPAAAPPPSTESEDKSRRWVSYGLAGAGLVGVGVGAALLAAANNQTQTGCTTPPPDQDMTTGAIIAFSVGGAAILSALIVYVTTPHAAPAKEASSLLVTPAALPGGGGAFVRAAF
jgi:hypothetical protein